MNKAALNRSVSFQGYYDAGEEYYVSCYQFNGLLKIYKNTKEAEFIASFPKEPTTKQALHQTVFCVGQTLVFAPVYASGIHTYHLGSGQMEYYPVEMPGCKKVRCMDAHMVGNKLWLFYSYADNPIVVFDVITHKMTYYKDIIDILPKEIKERKFAAFWSLFARNGYDLYAPVWRSPYILHMNLENRKTELISLEGFADSIIGVAYDEGIFYLTEWEKEEIKAWNPLDDTKTVYRPLEDMGLNNEYRIVYTNVIACQGQIILVPNAGTRVFRLRKEDGAIVPFCDFPEEYEEFTEERKSWRKHLSFECSDEGIRLFPSRGNMMLDINVSGQTVHGQDFLLGENWEKECYANIFAPYIREQTVNGRVCENKIIELDDFIKYVTTM